MKKILVMMLSCFTMMAVAQTEKPSKPVEGDKSLDGRSFRITLKEKEGQPRASQYEQYKVPQNQTGVNTGTIDTRTGVQQQSNTHTTTDPNATGNVTTNRDRTEVNTMDTGTGSTTTVTDRSVTQSTDPSGTTVTDKTATQDQMNTGNTMDSNNSGTTQGTTTPGNTGTATQQNTTIQQENTTQTGTYTQTEKNTNNMAAAGSVYSAEMNGKSVTISFKEGMLKAGALKADKSKSDAVEEEEKDMFDACAYEITSGSGGLSTFTANCSGETNRSKAYWNGYVNEGTISGNLVIYHSDGMSSSYSFTGKSTRADNNRKATSSR